MPAATPLQVCRFSAGVEKGLLKQFAAAKEARKQALATKDDESAKGQRDLGLSDKDAPKLDPMAELGSGGVQEKQKAWMSEIIEHLNTLFGSDMTDGDLLSYARTVQEKTLESEVLQQQAANNTEEQFASSPDLTSAILSAILESMDAQGELSKRALNSKQIQDGLKRVLLQQLGLYEGLKARAIGEQ